MWNHKLMWRVFKVFVALAVFLFTFNSCDDTNPVAPESEMTLMSMEQDTINPGDLPMPMIVVVHLLEKIGL